MERPFARVWSDRSAFKLTEGRVMWDFRDKFFAVGVVRPHPTHSCAGLGCREAPLTLVEGQDRRFGIVRSSDWGGFGLCFAVSTPSSSSQVLHLSICMEFSSKLKHFCSSSTLAGLSKFLKERASKQAKILKALKCIYHAKTIDSTYACL